MKVSNNLRVKMSKNIIITGPTATGKTNLAVKIASDFDGEIISADSRQVYKHLDIGTGKDIEEYENYGNPIKYHLIDIADPNEEYNLMRFKQDAPKAIKEILKKEKLPIIAGGTPLYIDSLISNYKMKGGGKNSELRKSLKTLSKNQLLEKLKILSLNDYEELKNSNNCHRMIRTIERCTIPDTEEPIALPQESEWLILGVYFHRKTIHKRIEERLDARLNNGMVEEVKNLHEKMGVSWERLDFLGLEYRYIALYLKGELEYNEMRNRLLVKIRQFAKRQDIWFRKMEREGHIIHWVKNGDFQKASNLVKLFLMDKPLPAPEIKISEIDYGKKCN